MNNMMASGRLQNHGVPMDMIRLLILGTVSLMNLSLPFLEMTGTLIDGIGITFNALIGTVGLVVLYLLRNQVDYTVTFTNRNKKEKKERPLSNQEEEETTEMRDEKVDNNLRKQ